MHVGARSHQRGGLGARAAGRRACNLAVSRAQRHLDEDDAAEKLGVLPQHSVERHELVLHPFDGVRRVDAEEHHLALPVARREGGGPRLWKRRRRAFASTAASARARGIARGVAREHAATACAAASTLLRRDGGCDAAEELHAKLRDALLHLLRAHRANVALRVDADRRNYDLDKVPVVHDALGGRFDREEALAGPAEVRRGAEGLEAEQIRGEEALDHIDAPRQHAKELARAEWLVEEEADARARELSAHHERREHQVVPVDPNDRIRRERVLKACFLHGVRVRLVSREECVPLKVVERERARHAEALAPRACRRVVVKDGPKDRLAIAVVKKRVLRRAQRNREHAVLRLHLR